MNVKTMDVKLIVFTLNEEEYAIPVEQVKAIEKPLHITRVPRAASYIKGVINLRGTIIPIIDLKKRLNIGEAAETNETRMIIATTGEMEVGLVVDGANDVLDIPVETIEDRPDVAGTAVNEYITGVAKFGHRLLILLNLENVLNPN